MFRVVGVTGWIILGMEGGSEQPYIDLSCHLITHFSSFFHSSSLSCQPTILVLRHLAIASSAGHVATFDWQAGKLHSEIQLGETVRDVK